ncbi:hypothetical protein [Aquipuribacter sp. SD81]|uniref:hypothetical protein n=1 Tax=Aquipuribacter sp. SD81 TaxID=3127703 RepID=UPI0030183694
MNARDQGATSAARAVAALRRAVADGSLDALCERHLVQVLVLFGSAVDSEQPADVDLGVVPGPSTDLLRLHHDLAVLLDDDRVDLVSLRGADELLSHRALSGEGLYEDEPGRFARARDLAARRYADTDWMRRLQAQVLGG